jgi:hypothetical protein
MTTSAPDPPTLPPGVCDCGRDPLLETPGADVRILFLTRAEEKRLIDRLENLQSLTDLEHVKRRMFEQLGIRVDIAGFQRSADHARYRHPEWANCRDCVARPRLDPGGDSSRHGKTPANRLRAAQRQRPVAGRMMNPVLKFPITDEILTDFALAIGTDLQGYRNHVYRVLNFYCAVSGIQGLPCDAVQIAAAFHDLTRTDNTLDYLPPSIRLASEYLDTT